MNVSVANDIEVRFAELTPDEQSRLLRRLHGRVREAPPAGWEAELSAMAADPQVRGELGRIEVEFRVAEADGLGSFVLWGRRRAGWQVRC